MAKLFSPDPLLPAQSGDDQRTVLSTATSPFTLEALGHRIASDTGLPKTRRRDIQSALLTFAKVLDRSLAELPADRRWVTQHLRSIHPARHGLSKKRWQNVCADLSFALDYAGWSNLKPRTLPLQPEWVPLRALLTTKRLRAGLTHFIGYCNSRAVTPQQVDDTVSNDYREYLTDRCRRNVHRIHKDVCRIWNEARAQFPEWPDTELTVPTLARRGYTYPWDTLSPELRAEVDRYIEWLGGRELLLENPPPRPCRPATLRTRRLHIQIVASAAIRSGFSPGNLNSLAVLTSEPCVRAALEYFVKQSESPPTSLIQSLLSSVGSVSRYWLRLESSSLDWLSTIMKRIPPRSPGMTPKNRAMLRQFESEDNVLRLLELPSALMREARNPKKQPRRQALACQIALAIEILIVAPVRMQNLRTIRIDQNLVKPDPRKRSTHLAWSESQVKNGLALEYPLPDSTLEILEAYLRIFRPRLGAGDSPWLFPGRGGNAKSHACLASQICKTVLNETGLVLTPHQLRHLAAKTYLDRHPGDYENVRRVLGHKSINTTLYHYTGLEIRAAVEHFDTHILALRNKSSKKGS